MVLFTDTMYVAGFRQYGLRPGACETIMFNKTFCVHSLCTQKVFFYSIGGKKEGLTKEEAEELLKEKGENVLKEGKKKTVVRASVGGPD